MTVKKKMKVIGLLMALVLLGGCGTKNEDIKEDIKEEIKEQEPSVAANDITFSYSQYESEPSKGYEIKSVDYDLGSQILKAPGEKDTPYHLRGMMSYPTNAPEEKLKTVILLHGVHDNFNERRYDIGFQYITEYLAENGYLAVSIDVNAAYDWNYGDNRERVKMPLIFEENINMLKEWNQGGENSYGIELKNKIDLESIMLFGHSTAGEIAFKIAAEEKNGVDYLLCVAPTYGYLESIFDIPLKGLSIVVPEYDGDVVGLDGFAIQNELIHSSKQELSSTTLLKKANHNYFNTVLAENDAESTGKDISDQIAMDEQRTFLKKFVVSNANAFFHKDAQHSIFKTDIATINMMDDFEVLTHIQTNQDLKIADANTPYIVNEQMNVTKETDSVNLTQDTAPGLNMALIGDRVVEVSHVVWESKEAKMEIPLEITDFTRYSSLELGVMLDPNSEYNLPSESQGLSIVLTDGQGKTQKVSIPKASNGIFYPRGKMDRLDLRESGVIAFWDGVSLVSDIRIPLSMFDGIDTKNISGLQILFDETEKGAIYLQTINLLKSTENSDE